MEELTSKMVSYAQSQDPIPVFACPYLQESSIEDVDAEKYNNGDCVKLENGFSNTIAGVTNVTAGFYGLITKIEKNIECKDESTTFDKNKETTI